MYGSAFKILLFAFDFLNKNIFLYFLISETLSILSLETLLLPLTSISVILNTGEINRKISIPIIINPSNINFNIFCLLIFFFSF